MATKTRAVRKPKSTCPHCGEKVVPLPTAENLDVANFLYPPYYGTPEKVAINPLMCPECFCVGGYEDF